MQSQNNLQKAINLAKKTGDKVIVFDNSSDSAYVVLSLENYEKLAEKENKVRGLTEKEMLDKINHDIALWKSEQDFFAEELEKENFIENSFDEEAWQNDEEFDFEDYEDDSFDEFNFDGEDELKESLIDYSKPTRKKRWSIPRERKENAEEIVDEEQYIEEIPF